MSDPQISGLRQLCSFLVDGILFGVDVTHVQEVIRHQDITPVPLSPRVVSGLINLRGRIVTAIDLRERLGAQPRPPGSPPTNLVVRHAEGVLSLLVDEIGDVVEVDESCFEAPPDTLTAASRALIDGVYKFKPQLLLLLNTERAIRLEPFGVIKRNDHVQQ